MDPYDPDSYFAILHATVETNGQVFSWPGHLNRLYTVLVSEDLTGGMTNRPEYTDHPGVDGTMMFTNAITPRINLFGVRVRLAP